MASSAGRCRTLHGAGAAPGPCQAACRARRANRSATNLTQEHCRDSPRPRQLRNARCLEVGSRHSVAGDRCCCSSPQSPFCAQTEIDGTRRRRGRQLRACCYFFTPRILPVVSRATSLCCPRRPHAAAAHAATAHQGVCASGRLRISEHVSAGPFRFVFSLPVPPGITLSRSFCRWENPSCSAHKVVHKKKCDICSVISSMPLQHGTLASPMPLTNMAASCIQQKRDRRPSKDSFLPHT